MINCHTTISSVSSDFVSVFFLFLSFFFLEVVDVMDSVDKFCEVVLGVIVVGMLCWILELGQLGFKEVVVGVNVVGVLVVVRDGEQTNHLL